jgi:hypothetical protein
MHTEEKEPDGIAEGWTSNASQQSKHFQFTSATVLCTTVNFTALKALVGRLPCVTAALLNTPDRFVGRGGISPLAD